MSSPVLPKKLLPNPSIKQLILVALLALFVAVGALPHYFGSWPWSTPPKLLQAERSALQAIRDTGIELPGWQTIEQTTTKLGGKTWSIQQLSAHSSASQEGTAEMPAKDLPLFLLLRPQVYEADQPEVEWLDIKGSQHWDTDSSETLSFRINSIDGPDRMANAQAARSKNNRTIRISAQFFRAWSKEQTYAVLQWYAWPTGGSPSPAQWFWADQLRQWRHYHRMPWVAVSLWLPIDPLSPAEDHQALAQSLGQTIQQVLLDTVFAQSDLSGANLSRSSGGLSQESVAPTSAPK